MMMNCEKCKLLYETVAFTKPDGTTDGQLSKCPRCNHWNGRGYLREYFKKITGRYPDFIVG